jgi:hypothetical protein
MSAAVDPVILSGASRSDAQSKERDASTARLRRSAQHDTGGDRTPYDAIAVATGAAA